MIDATLIEKLQEIAATHTADMEHTDFPAVVIPGSSKVVSLEHLHTNPAIFRAVIKTRYLQSFLSYYNSQDHSGHVFVDPETMSATAIFDMGTQDNPGWGHHRAVVNLQKTQPFAALLRNDNNAMNQQDLIDFACDYCASIEFFDTDDQPIPFERALNSIRQLSIDSIKKRESNIGDFKASQSALDSVEITAGGTTPPAYFLFSEQAFEDLSPVVIVCRLRALTNGDKIALKYRIEALHQHTENLADEFQDVISNGLEGALIYVGTIEYQEQSKR